MNDGIILDYSYNTAIWIFMVDYKWWIYDVHQKNNTNNGSSINSDE